MDTKKYFDDPQTIVSSTDIDSLAKEVESYKYMGAYIQEKERFIPRIDFSSASNFAFFGSAKQYYNDAIKKIYQTYPYDGSLYEKTSWHLSSSYLDNYIFENEYPRTNGYILLTARDDATPWDGTNSNDYVSASNTEYILFRGGPHPSTRSKGKEITDTAGTYKSGYSNIYDQSENRESNLKLGGNDGNTVEFWMKKEEINTSFREVIFDTHTANATTSETGYGRLRVELEKNAAQFKVTYMSGANDQHAGYATASLGQGLAFNDTWHHYAFTFKNQKVGKSILFDGTDDYISIGQPPVLNFTPDSDSFTLSTWIKTTSTANGHIIGIVDGSNVTSAQYWIAVDGSSDKVIGVVGGHADFSRSDSTINDDEWHHVVLVSNGTTHTLYIDGAAQSNTGTCGSTTKAGIDLLIGARRDGNNTDTAYHFDGYIDEVTIWKTDLSATEVAELYNEGQYFNPTSHSEAANLVSWWDMGETTPNISPLTPNYKLIDTVGDNDAKMHNFDSSYGIKEETKFGGYVRTKFYLDGECNDSFDLGNSVNYVSGGMLATLGALATSLSGNGAPQLGWAPLSASLDEFRFWKTERNAQQIGRHWFTQVGGGTNTDKANTHLGVYYKFNEGITTDTSLDSVTLDYSGRVNNGAWTGYTSGHRQTGSAIVLSNLTTASYEFKDPILYSTHPKVNEYLTSSLNKGGRHDLTNNAAIYNSLPAWIIDEDGENGETLKKLTQIMASYFDTLQLQIQELPTLKNVIYPSGSYEKPYPLIKDALESKGFVTSEIFADADILTQFLNQSNKELFEKKLYHIKNQIYQNIYNSLSHIYKTKGTEKAFRNLIRCFGVDHEVLKLNLYANESDYTFEDNFSSVTVNKNCVDFNNPSRFNGTVYQFTSSTNANSISFISGSKLTLTVPGNADAFRAAIPFTTEAEIIFPKYGTPADKNHFTYSNLSASLFGVHTARQTSYIPSGDTQATATITFSGAAAAGQTLTIVDTDGTSIAYTAATDEDTTADPPEFENLTGGATAIAASLKACIDSANGHNGTISVVDNGDGSLSLTQATAGADGNTTMVDSGLGTGGGINTAPTLVQWSGGTPGGINYNDLAWHSNDVANFQVYACRKTLGGDSKGFTNKDAYFVLTSSYNWGLPELTSSIFREVYDNRKWNFAVRVKPTKYPLASYISGTLSQMDEKMETVDSPLAYTIEFYGVNSDLNIVNNEFLVTGALTQLEGENFLSSSKRVYAGGHRTNFTGSALVPTDVKFSSLRCWLDYLDNETIQSHARDPKNIGRLSPHKPAYLFEVLPTDGGTGTAGHDRPDAFISQPYVPQMETLALNWDFTSLTSSGPSNSDTYYGTSTKNARFPVADMSSGSTDITSSYGAISEIVSLQHTGRGDFFPSLNKSVISKEYIYAAKQNIPENVHSSDMIKISNTDDVVFTRHIRPTTNFFAIEKSMYQTISEEILRFFATVKDFNNLIGEPVNRYRQDYKALGKLRQLFFERKVEDTDEIVSPDLEKYIDYYKWIDQSISKMIRQIIPASARFSENIRNVIESHVLERNKYWSKLPIIEKKTKSTKEEAEGAASNQSGNNDAGANNQGAGQGDEVMMTPSFVVAHANLTEKLKTVGPAKMSIRLPDSETWSRDDASRNTLSWGRATTTEPAITTGDSDINNERKRIFDAIIKMRRRENRRTAHLDIAIFKPIHGGVTTLTNKKPTLFRTLINNVSGSEHVGLEITNQKVIENDIVQEYRRLFFPKEKKREFITTSREKSRGSTADTGERDYFGDSYSKWVIPFTAMSSSVNTGYNSTIVSEFTAGIDFANLHQDIYAPHYEVPMQGTFTEKWAGGNLYRHVFSQLQPHGFTTDDVSTRVEGWAIDFREDSSGKFIVFRSPISASIQNPRAMFWTGPKRPVNIKNIRMTTGSGGFQDPTGSTKSGNYRFDYNVVSTSGRKINNRYFVKNNGINIDWADHQKPDSEYLPIQGVPDFTSINRFVTGSNKFIFVNKFGAPGGPETMSEAFLDLEAGEYSVYNSLNYRNLAVRLPLREYLTNHANQFGYWSDTQYSASWQTAIDTGFKAAGTYAGTQTNVKSAGYVGTSAGGQPMPSYHKINRNSLRRIELENASSHNTITGTVHDNYWVQHPIPRTDIQYSWVSASLISGYTGSVLYGYEQPRTNNIRRYGSDASTDLTLLSASLTGAAVIAGGPIIPVDFAGLNTLIYDPLSSSLNLLSSSNGVYKNTNIASIVNPNDFNSLILHRQGPYGWPSWKQVRQAQHPIARKERKDRMISFLYKNKLNHYTESFATSRYSPMVHVFKEGTIQHTYGNNLASFANIDVQNKLKSKLYGGDQAYDYIKKLYLEDIISLKPNLISLYYKEMIYPRETNVYLAKARMRTNYIVDFWRGSRSDRTKVSATNSQGQTILKQSLWPLDAREDFATATARGKASSAGNDGAGELQNNYTTYIGDTDSSGLAVKVIPAACYARPISASAAEGELLYGDTLWEAGDPFYDSYDDYSNEIRRVGQNYSIASEFRMSEHMEYFLDEKNGNFFADREGFLTCTGSNYADSTADNFFKTYSHSDFLKYFSLVYEDHKGVVEPSRISLTCNTIMKLLPYKGFYPADRTLQLATLFSQSYSSTEFGTDSYSDNSKRRVALTPFFAPGILYNTIKSGLAVDYPIYTKQPGSTTAGGTVDRDTVYTEGTGSTSANSDVYRLSASFDFRLPFDSLVRPETYIGYGTSVYEAEPDPRARVSGSATTNAATASIKLDLTKSDTYKLAMHNFLATSIDLFLKNGEVSTLVTSKQEDIYIVDRNINTYKMRVYLSDHQDVSATHSRNFSMYNRQLAFGPTVNAPDNVGGYAPFTPPYYYNDSSTGYSYVEYSFAPWKHTVAEKYGTEGTDEYTLDEIISNSTITEFRKAGNSQFSGSSSGDNYVQDINMMNLTASVNIFQKDGHLVVQPKFETPIFNFTNVTKTSPTSGDASTKGIWHQKGTYETNNSKGIFLGVLDVADSESLADLITIDKGFKKIGLLPDDKEKTIREAVIAIPVIKKFNKRTNNTQTKFINVHKNMVKRAVADISGGKTSEESTATTSIYDMVKAMQGYIIPPQFDFLTRLKKFGSKKFSPFAMYIFEFEHELSQEELANIWQNIRPEIAQTHKKEKAVVKHTLAKGELLTAKELNNPDLHWMVFKVKQKAKWNYFDKVIDLAGTLVPRADAGAAPTGLQLSDARSNIKDIVNYARFDSDIAPGSGLDYSYNWPYDFCSLVELIKVGAEVQFGGKGMVQIHPPSDKSETPMDSLGSKRETVVVSDRGVQSVSARNPDIQEEASSGFDVGPISREGSAGFDVGPINREGANRTTDQGRSDD